MEGARVAGGRSLAGLAAVAPGHVAGPLARRLLRDAEKRAAGGDQEGARRDLERASGIIVRAAVLPGSWASPAPRLPAHYLVLAAETAVRLRELGQAEELLAQYKAHAHFFDFGKFNQSGAVGDVARVEPADQFAARALFATATIKFLQKRHLKGEELVEGLLSTLGLVVEGIQRAEKDPRHHFLMFNGAMHFYRISRQLQRKGLRRHLTKSIDTVAGCLSGKYFKGGHEWRANFFVAQALCLAESNKGDDALKALAEAHALAKELGNQELQDRILNIRTHLSITLGKGAKTDASSSPEDAARVAVQSVRSGEVKGDDKIEAELRAAWSKIDSNPKGSARNVNLDIVADIGWVAAMKGRTDLAKECMSRVKPSGTARARTRMELTMVMVDLQGLRDARHDLSRENIQRHIRFMAKVGQALSTFLNIKDAAGIHDSCVLIWNASLVLLQKDLRHHVKDIFRAAAEALERIDSPMHRLRAQFHLEVSKCFIEEDMLIPATRENQKALSLDYLVDEDEKSSSGYVRPLDRYLEPMQKKLKLKCAIYEEPNDPQDAAVVLIEKARSTDDVPLKEHYLEKAIVKLQCLKRITAALMEKGSQAEVNALKSRIQIWGELVKTAWEAGLHATVRKSAPEALAFVGFNPARDFETMRLQAEVYFMDAQACICSLKVRKEKLCPPRTAVEVEVSQPLDPFQDINMRAASGFLTGMKIGAAINEPWLIIRGAAHVFNVYLPFILDGDLVSLLPLLEPVFEELVKVQEESVDPEVLCAVANFLACALEHKYLIGLSDDGETNFKVLQKRPFEGGGDVAFLEKAADVCQQALKKSSKTTAKQLVSTFAHIQGLRGLPADNGVCQSGGDQELISKAMAMIEVLNNSNSPEAEKRQAVEVATASLRQVKPLDLEMWADLARACLQAGELEGALDACDEALSILPEGDEFELEEQASRFTQYQWHLLSSSEMMYGSVVESARSPDIEQEQEIKEKLWEKAISHYMCALRYATFARSRDLFSRATRVIWNACIQFTSQSSLRLVVTVHLEKLCSLVDTMGVQEGDFILMVSVYRCLLQCFADSSRWLDGMKMVASAFKHLPSPLHRRLWDYHVFFLSKMGRSVSSEMSQMADFTEEMQSKVWRIMTNSSHKYDQVVAHKGAINSLQDPVIKAESLIHYCEWLYKTQDNSYGDSYADSEDALYVALDVLMGHDDSRTTETLKKRGARGAAAAVRAYCSLARIASEQSQYVSNLLMAYKCTALILENALPGSSSFPTSAADWVDFDFTEEHFEQLQKSDSENSLSRIPHFESFLSQLSFLEESLRMAMLEVFAIPVCYLQSAIATFKPSIRSLKDCGLLMASALLQSIGEATRAKEIRDRVGDLSISVHEMDLSHLAMAQEQSARSNKCSQSSSGSEKDVNDTVNEVNMLKPIDINMAWVFKARYLMSCCDYDMAVHMLQAALVHAQSSKDSRLATSCMALIAECEIKRNNPEGAVKVLMKAQQDIGNISFWRGTTALLVKSYSMMQDVRTARSHLESMVKTFKTLLENTSYLNLEITKTTVDMLQQLGSVILASLTVPSLVETPLQKYEKAVQCFKEAVELSEHFASPEAVEVRIAYAMALIDNPRPVADMRQRCIDVKEVLKGAETCALEIVRDAVPVSNFSNTKISLAAERLLARVKNIQASNHIRMYSYNFQYLSETRHLHEVQFPKVEGRDSSSVKEFLENERLASRSSSLGVCDEAIILASGAQCLAPQMLEGFQAEYLLGASYIHPTLMTEDTLELWTRMLPEDYGTAKGSDNETEAEAEAGVAAGEGSEEPRAEVALGSSDGEPYCAAQRISRGTHILENCVKSCIAASQYSVAARAARSLLWVGNSRQDVHAAFANLCMSQGCAMRQDLLKIFHQSADFSNLEARLLQMQENVRDNCLSPPEDEYVMKWSKEILREISNMDVILSLDRPFDDCIEILPTSTTYIVLHISEGVCGITEGAHLYLAGLRVEEKDGERVTEEVMDRMPVDMKEITGILEDFSAWKNQTTKAIREMQSHPSQVSESESGEAEDTEAAPDKRADDSTEGGKPQPQDEATPEISAIQSGWKQQLQRVSKLLEPLQHCLKTILNQGKSEEEVRPRSVLMVDKILAALPFEALECFQDSNVVARELCVHMMANRVQQCADNPKLDLKSAKYLVDPMCEDTEKSSREPGRQSRPLSEEFTANIMPKYGPAWTGAIGSVPRKVGEGEASHLFLNSSTMMFLGLHRFLAYVPPHTVSRMNLRTCRLALIMDQISNESSSRRLSYLDHRKTHVERSLEDPFEATALLLLRGVSCVVMSSLPTVADSNVSFLSEFLSTLQGGAQVGHAVRVAARACVGTDALPFVEYVPVTYGLPDLTS